MNISEISKNYFEIVPKLMHVLRVEIRSAASPGLTIPQLRVLAHINRGLVFVGEIAEHHGVSQPAMSKLIEGLVVRKLVKRAECKTDRRSKRLSLTPKGKTLFFKVKSIASSELEKKISGLPDKKRKELSHAIEAFTYLIEFLKSEEVSN